MTKLVKCNSIDQVPVSTDPNEQQIIFVASGELYADLEIGGTMCRVRLSNVVPASELPTNPDSRSLYISDGRLCYVSDSNYIEVANKAELNALESELQAFKNAVYARLEAL